MLKTWLSRWLTKVKFFLFLEVSFKLLPGLGFLTFSIVFALYLLTETGAALRQYYIPPLCIEFGKTSESMPF